MINSNNPVTPVPQPWSSGEEKDKVNIEFRSIPTEDKSVEV
jgi:hypothetical protein